MEKAFFQIGTLALTLLAVAQAFPPTAQRPPYIDCVNHSECGTFECCSIGLGRFSLPTCRPLREVGEACSPNATSHRADLSYPDGSQVILESVYYNICPCSIGLTCSRASGTCTDPLHFADENMLI